MGAAGDSSRFASNLCTLVFKYGQLLVKGASGGLFASAALIAGIYAAVATFQALFQEEEKTKAA